MFGITLNTVSYTLIIIDIQPAFFTTASNPRVIRNITKAIDKAKKDKAYIVLVEYKRCGNTFIQIQNKLSKYRKTILVYKNTDDGSADIAKVLSNKRNASKKYFKICGVNTDACVQDTVLGLNKRFKDLKIKILSNACNTGDYRSHINAIKKLSRYENISSSKIY